MTSVDVVETMSDAEDEVIQQHASVATPDSIRKHFSRDRGSGDASPSSAAKKRRGGDEIPHTPTPKRVNHNMAPGSPANPIEIADDEESSQALMRHILEVSARSEAEEEVIRANPEERFDGVELNMEDYMTDAEITRYIRKLSLREEREQKAKLEERVSIALHSSDEPRFCCKAGKSVELIDGTFLYIKDVLKDGHGKIFVTGYQLVRQNSLGLMMPKRRNEVVLVRQVPQFTNDAWSVLHEIPVGDVCRNRTVIFTNQSFPKLSSREDAAAFSVPGQDVQYGPLFCRWTFTTIINERKKTIEDVVERIDFVHADDALRRTTASDMRPAQVAHDQLREGWRQCKTILGGSHQIRQDTMGLDGSIEFTNMRSYTIGDAFCGAGGTSRGAIDAGLRLLWGFDINREAISSYKLNFERLLVDCRNESVSDFITHLSQLVELDDVRVDILHISPPCQPFSPAHTIPSQERDEVNQAALPSVWQLVDRLRPRIVTIEETEGLFSRHREWFYLLINTFTCFGYSVRWKVVQCHSYGVPQTRKRLIIVAAGPGEKLPPFPQPTHATNDPDLKGLATINGTIDGIPCNADDHDQTVQFETGPRPPFDGNTQAKTITTNAGQGNYHPSGRRPYTLRELARLQTFPLYHSFAGAKGITEKRRQIGNAVPPILAKAMFKSIVRSLKESDEAEMALVRAQG